MKKDKSTKMSCCKSVDINSSSNNCESKINIINTKAAPIALGAYSQAVEVNGMIYTSGQIAINPNNNQIDASNVAEQTKQVCENLSQVLAAAGSSMEKVIKATCFLTNMQDFSIFNEVYAKYFISKPARSCVEVSALPKGVLVEIELIAIKI